MWDIYVSTNLVKLIRQDVNFGLVRALIPEILPLYFQILVPLTEGPTHCRPGCIVGQQGPDSDDYDTSKENRCNKLGEGGQEGRCPRRRRLLPSRQKAADANAKICLDSSSQYLMALSVSNKPSQICWVRPSSCSMTASYGVDVFLLYHPGLGWGGLGKWGSWGDSSTAPVVGPPPLRLP